MRVAFCITELEPGGAERALVEIAVRLDRGQYEPKVYVLAPPPRRDELLSQLNEAGIESQFIGATRRSQFLGATRKLSAAWRQWRPHVAQSFLHHANIVGRFAARRARVPVVVSGIRVAETRSRWPLRIDRWTSGLVDRHVCVSQSVLCFTRDTARLPADKLLVIPNGVDVSQFQGVSPVELTSIGVDPKHRVMLFVGRLEAQKGLDLLLQAMPAILQGVPDLHLLVAGEGPQATRLVDLASQMGIEQRVHWLGWRSEVPSLLAASDLLVLPSRWEGMPNVVLEAMAAARPVVACDVEGVRELLGHDAALQIVPPGDSAALAKAVTAVLCTDGVAPRLGAANQQRAKSCFSWTQTSDAYGALYHSLLSKPGRAE